MTLYANIATTNGVTNLTLPTELTEPVLRGTGLDPKLGLNQWRLRPNHDPKKNIGTIKAGEGRKVSAKGVSNGRRFQYHNLPVPDFPAMVVPIRAEGEELILDGVPTGITFEDQLRRVS